MISTFKSIKFHMRSVEGIKVEKVFSSPFYEKRQSQSFSHPKHPLYNVCCVLLIQGKHIIIDCITIKAIQEQSRREEKAARKKEKNQILMDKQFLMFAVNNNLTLFVSLEINDGSEKKLRKRDEKCLVTMFIMILEERIILAPNNILTI